MNDSGPRGTMIDHRPASRQLVDSSALLACALVPISRRASLELAIRAIRARAVVAMASPGGRPGAPAPAPAVPASPTPPLGLVALLGRADLHPAVAQHLRSGPRAPLECAGVDDIAAASSVIGARKRTRAVDAVSAAAALAAANPSVAPPLAAGDASSRPAIVPGSPLPPPGASSAASPPPSRPAPKPGWLRKHRERRPAVAVAFVPHELVEGDPNAWVSLVALLDAARDAAALGDCKLAVVVVGDDAPERLPEDRASAVRRQARVDARSLLTLPQPPPPDALRRLASLCRDLADERYDAERARREALFARRRAASDEAGAARAAFKAGAFSEFRGDWKGASRWYETAYESLLLENEALEKLATATTRSSANADADAEASLPYFFARRDEVLAAAEATHRAVVTLALARAPADPTAVASAVERQRLHCAALKRPPGWLPRRRVPEHWLWAAAQHEAFGEALAARIETAGTESSGVAAKETKVSGVPRACLPGFHFHAAADAIEKSIRATEVLGEDEDASVASGASVATAHTLAARQIALLSAAEAHFERAAPRETAPRLFTALASRLAENYLRVNDALAAKTRLRSVADAYRREGWDDLARGALMALKRCAGEDPRERLEVCLELAALAPASARDGDQHGGDAAGAMAAANAAAAEAREHAGGANVEVLVGDFEGARDAGPREETSTSRRRTVPGILACAAGFVRSENADGAPSLGSPDSPVSIVVAVKSALPETLEVVDVRVAFSDPAYDVAARASFSNASLGPGPASLPPNAWRRFEAAVVPAWNRPVEIEAVVFATACGITFRANVPPTSGNGSAGERGVRDDGKGFRLPDFVAEARLAPTSLDLRGAPPRVRFEAKVDEAVSSRGPALLGEACAVRLAVVSAGDGVRDAEVVFERGPFEVFRDAAATERVAETDAIRAGDVPPGGSWRGVVYARRGDLSAGSTSTLVAALRGVPTPRKPEENEAAPDTSAPAPALASRKIAETALEIDVRAPFTASSASFAAYRTHALTFDAASARNQAARTLAVVRVAAEGARLAVAAEGGASDFFVLDEGDEFVRAAPGGGAASLDVAWRRVTEDGAGGEGGGEHRASVGVVSSESIARDAAGAGDATPPSEAPVTVTLDAPATIRAGSPFHLFLRVKNATDAPQPMTVQVADAAGFVFAGARSRAAVVAPRSELEVGYALVPVASGEMLLPELVVHATRLEARLAPPKVARAVFVRPAGGGRAEE